MGRDSGGEQGRSVAGAGSGKQQPKSYGGSIVVGRDSGGEQGRGAAGAGSGKLMRKLGCLAAAKALRWKYSRGQGVWWRAREKCCWNREGDVPAETGKLNSSQGGSRVVGRESGGEQGRDAAVPPSSWNSPTVTTGPGCVLEEPGQPKMPWRRWRCKKGEQHLTSCGGRIAVGTPAVCRERGDVQQHLTSYGGRIAVGTLAVCSGRRYSKSRGVAVCTPR